MPSEIKGQPVLRLGEEGKDGCGLNPYHFKEIVLPDHLEVIGEGAFSNVKWVETFVLPKSLVSIERMAFYNCMKLKQLELPEGLKTIGESAFIGCISLKQLELPEGLEVIGGDAFWQTGIKEITIPATVNELGGGILEIEQVKFEGKKYNIVDGVVYKNDSELIDCSRSKKGKLVIPSGICLLYTSDAADEL